MTAMQPQSGQNWQFGVPFIKQEVMEEDRNDSGITSGSECTSSASPGSDSQDVHHYGPRAPSHSAGTVSRVYATPVTTGLYVHPLTPPSSEPNGSPKQEDKELEHSPCASPSTPVQRVGGGAPEEPIRVPKVNSHGKVRTWKCKQCNYVTYIKQDYWSHTSVHIRADKRLFCPHCPFVTEYKHHLEYHINNHTGAKPYKCEMCDYSCVNKSMLNSHMKSHSSIYQYRCADCSYATKYCHSLKIHLRRHQHNADIVLNPDGTPNPLPIVDPYGTRRGPKMKPNSPTTVQRSSSNNELSSPPPPPVPLNLSAAIQNPFAFNLLAGFPFPDVFQNFQQLLLRNQQIGSDSDPLAEPNKEEPNPEPATTDKKESKSEVLDLSIPSTSRGETAGSSRRKGPSFKYVRSYSDYSTTDSEEDDTLSHISCEQNPRDLVEDNNNEVNNNEVNNNEIDRNVNNNNNNNNINRTCPHCDLTFGDQALFLIHMGLHGTDDPFTCRVCNVKCESRVEFFMHIMRSAH